MRPRGLRHGAFVEHDQVEVELEQALALGREVRRPAREGLLHDRVRMRGGRHHRCRPLDDVLVDAERLVELP
jgi:hypothetical protein